MAGEEKTEKATPKKRQDAREKEGSVLISNEVVIAVSVMGTFVILALFGQYMLTQLMQMLTTSFDKLDEGVSLTNEFFMEIAFDSVVFLVLIIAPFMIANSVINILPVIVQTRGFFSTKPMRFKFSKLNPLTGIKRLFSIQSAVGIVKGIIELAVIILLIYMQINGKLAEIKKLTDMTLMQGVSYTANSIFSLVMLISIVLIFVAASDFVFQWWQFEKKLKMSKQEVKDEYKQIEGDPQIKSKIKAKQREMSQARMMEEVPTSDVVIRNPTHFAVALKYDTSEKATAAPKIVAKGQDALALKIIAIATEHGVYIVENRPLARALYENIEVGMEISPEFYKAIAAIIAELYEVQPERKKKT